MIITTIAGMLIGLPTLRLRGDYIAIVTLAFGEIIGRIVINGDEIMIGGEKITNGRQGITPIDKIDLPFVEPFTGLELRPWYFVALGLVVVVLFVNYRLRDSRLGRAWIALREDEVAAASMGVPLVKTKLLAYGTGAAFGGIAGVFLGSYLNTVNADQFQFSFSIFVLAMVILGGLGSIEGVMLGAIVLSFINFNLIPDVFNDYPSKIGLDFDLTELSFGIFGFLLVIMMVLRPEGLIPERRRKLELTEGIGAGDDRARWTSESTSEGHVNDERQATRRQRRERRRAPQRRARDEGLRRPGGRRGRDVRDPASARSSRSSAPTAPARPPSSTCSPGCTGRPTGASRFDGTERDRPPARPDHEATAWRGRSRTSACSATMTALENVMVGQNARMNAGLFGSIFRMPRVRKEERAVRGEGARDARLRRASRERQSRPDVGQPLLRRPAPAGDRPGARLRPQAAAARRADGGHEPAGVRVAHRLHAASCATSAA